MYPIFLLLIVLSETGRVERYDEGGAHLIAQPFPSKHMLRLPRHLRHLRMFNLDTKPNEYTVTDEINAEKHEDSAFLKPLRNVCVGNKSGLTASEKLESFKNGIC